MPDLSFDITSVEPANRGVAPLLHFDLEITNTPADETVQSVMLQTQIRLEAAKRPYNESEREKLVELFGMPEDWGRSLNSRKWTHVSEAVPTFSGQTSVTLPVQCTYDLNVASAKYLYALEEGVVPLIFLFSGTVFYQAATGQMQVQRLARSKECTYRMPVSAWKEMMEEHYPGSAWLYLDEDVFERLYAHRRENGLVTWEQTIEDLLPEEEVQEASVQNGAPDRKGVLSEPAKDFKLDDGA